ncbi:response regulator [Vibrio aerogenes]|uniref:response regulator n=1 Tax=Vibrio aerogenes TaxID=92172 RepID=UPI000935C564|nr:response regulator [Vibrio aerogenes]
MKILIVDDSLATLEIVRRSLACFGYRHLSIEKTASAEQALEMIENWHPEIVLTDWHMPGKNGLELIQEITARQFPVKVAMITTVDEPARIQQALDAGASFVLTKPFDDSELHRYLLPLVQGAEESEKALDDVVEVQKELALPKLEWMEKLLKRQIHNELVLHRIRTQSFDESKLPGMLAVYQDEENQRPRAAMVLDLYAVCVFAAANQNIPVTTLQQAVRERVVGKEMFDTCERILADASVTFLDSVSHKSLRLKQVSFINEAFAKLEALYDRPADKRIDFSCELWHLAQGKVLIVGF